MLYADSPKSAVCFYEAFKYGWEKLGHFVANTKCYI